MGDNRKEKQLERYGGLDIEKEENKVKIGEDCEGGGKEGKEV